MDMEVSPMDSLGFADENHYKCRVNRTTFTYGVQIACAKIVRFA